MDNTRWKRVQSDPMLIFLSGNQPLFVAVERMSIVMSLDGYTRKNLTAQLSTRCTQRASPSYKMLDVFPSACLQLLTNWDGNNLL